MNRYLAIFITLVALILLGYPLALLFGLPLAQRDMANLSKWEKETITETLTLAGTTDGINREFSFGVPVVENDKARMLLVNGTELSFAAERPAERVDGEASVFTV